MAISLAINISFALKLGACLLEGCLLFILIMTIVSRLTRAYAIKHGTPVLGVITRRSHGLKILGEYELVVHVTYTDGSHVLMTEKCNTNQSDYFKYPLNSFCLLRLYKDYLYLDNDESDASEYFEDSEFATLEGLITNSDVARSESDENIM